MSRKPNWRRCKNLGEKDSVNSCAPTILLLQIGDLDSLWFLVLTPFGQWVHASSCSPAYLQIFFGVREKSENWDPTQKNRSSGLTQKLCEPLWLIVVFDGDAEGVEEDEDDDEPVEPLLLDRLPDPEPDLLLVRPEVRVLLELLLQSEPGSFFLLQKLWNESKQTNHKLFMAGYRWGNLDKGLTASGCNLVVKWSPRDLELGHSNPAAWLTVIAVARSKLSLFKSLNLLHN